VDPLGFEAGVLVVDWDDTGRGLQILGKTETYEREEGKWEETVENGMWDERGMNMDFWG
jgi:hypothetical protein